MAKCDQKAAFLQDIFVSLELKFCSLNDFLDKESIAQVKNNKKLNPVPFLARLWLFFTHK